jgi:hypothetical protein
VSHRLDAESIVAHYDRTLDTPKVAGHCGQERWSMCSGASADVCQATPQHKGRGGRYCQNRRTPVRPTQLVRSGACLEPLLMLRVLKPATRRGAERRMRR